MLPRDCYLGPKLLRFIHLCSAEFRISLQSLLYCCENLSEHLVAHCSGIDHLFKDVCHSFHLVVLVCIEPLDLDHRCFKLSFMQQEISAKCTAVLGFFASVLNLLRLTFPRLLLPLLRYGLMHLLFVEFPLPQLFLVIVLRLRLVDALKWNRGSEYKRLKLIGLVHELVSPQTLMSADGLSIARIFVPANCAGFGSVEDKATGTSEITYM